MVASHGKTSSVASNHRGSLTGVNLLCTQSQPVPSGGTYRNRRATVRTDSTTTHAASSALPRAVATRPVGNASSSQARNK